MHVLTISDVNTYLRELLESDTVLGDVWVLGEVSNFNRHSSGHCYFSLKHDNSVLKAVMWRMHAQRSQTLPHNGDAVLAHGRVSIYEARGDIQLYADAIQPAGVGLYHARFEELRARLEAEGLFDEARKRPLPRLPRRIGLVTAPGGAALRDMVQVIGRRFPLAEVLLAPCLVQGEHAPDSIVEALYGLYNGAVDLIILARGGGSIEDLWAFNDEAVVRAVFASPVPLITGVGHETDTTIVDFVADLRAPTPSAAAELAVPELGELQAELEYLRERLAYAVSRAIDERREQVEQASEVLRRAAPLARLARDRQQVDELLRRLAARVRADVELKQARLRGLNGQLAALSPQATLARGYAVVRRRSDGHVVRSAAQLAPGERLAITLYEGSIEAETLPNPP